MKHGALELAGRMAFVLRACSCDGMRVHRRGRGGDVRHMAVNRVVIHFSASVSKVCEKRYTTDAPQGPAISSVITTAISLAPCEMACS